MLNTDSMHYHGSNAGNGIGIEDFTPFAWLI
ncbi:hypothetical protein PS002_23765, partial [Shigella sonnei]|nr:hypothetical protein [Shigella sonnei]